MEIRPIKTEYGWEIWDGIAFEPDSVVYPSKEAAQEAANTANFEYRSYAVGYAYACGYRD